MKPQNLLIPFCSCPTAFQDFASACRGWDHLEAVLSDMSPKFGSVLMCSNWWVFWYDKLQFAEMDLFMLLIIGCFFIWCSRAFKMVMGKDQLYWDQKSKRRQNNHKESQGGRGCERLMLSITRIVCDSVTPPPCGVHRGVTGASPFPHLDGRDLFSPVKVLLLSPSLLFHFSFFPSQNPIMYCCTYGDISSLLSSPCSLD